MDFLYVDFETRSACDLKASGVDVYSKHPSTEVLCTGFALNEEQVHIASVGDSRVNYEEVFRYVSEGGTVVAHNAQFELAIWNNVCAPKYNWPPLKTEQCICTMAMAYAMSLPGSLENATFAVGMIDAKDLKGARTMLQLARPRAVDAVTGEITWWEDKEKFEKLFEYCTKDVIAERELFKRLLHANGMLTQKEKWVWQLDQKINNRGVGVAIPLVEKAINIVVQEQHNLNKEMRRVTNDAVATTTAVSQLTQWLKWRGVEVDKIAKADVVEALSAPNLPEDCKKALELRQFGSKASTAKFKRMISGASEGRIRGMFQYHGGHTGRWAGRRIMLHNLPKSRMPQEDIEDVFQILEDYSPNEAGELIRILYGSPLQVLSEALRGFLVPAPGKQFIAVDFEAIEARVLAWLSGEEAVLTIFRTHGKIYEAAAAAIFRKAIEDILKGSLERDVGKVAVLSFGFQGGVVAFLAMAQKFGLTFTEKEAESFKVAWREANARIVQYWYDVERSAIRAMRSGRTETAGAEGRKVKFKLDGSFLWCLLPSNRTLCYPSPVIQQKETPWGQMKDSLTYMGQDSITGKWERQTTYGGALVENIVQAVARDILVDAMFRVEAKGYPVVLHVHDELMVETEEDVSLEEVEAIVAEVPSWASGLPLAAKGWKGFRYRK